MTMMTKNQKMPFLRWVNARPGRVIASSFLLVILIGMVAYFRKRHWL